MRPVVHGTTVLELRLRRGLSIAELAKAAGIDAETIYSIEAGRRIRGPQMRTVRALAAAFGVDVLDLVALPAGTERTGSGPAAEDTAAEDVA